MGYKSVSVPFGAKFDARDGSNPNDEWIENDYEFLECFSRIYLCFDADEPGQKAAKSLVKRLGIDRCYFVHMPEDCKDANDVLLKDKVADLNDAIESAKTMDPAELKSVAEFKELVWETFHPNSEHELGIPFMFKEVPWRIRPGELTVWTGHSGHGKSTLLNHLLVHLADVGQRSCIASFEMAAKKSINQLSRQASGLNHFEQSDRPLFDDIFNWMEDRFWVVDRVGKLGWRELLEIFSYARKRYRVSQFVVDSLLRCGIPNDDYDQQKSFVDALVTFAQNNDSHVHLVAHSRKKEDERSAPGKLDVAGAGEITHLAHNVISIYRNKDKQDRIENAKMSGDTILESVLHMSDGHMEMHKQRETGDEPRQRFWFLHGPAQFCSNPQCGPKQYVTRFTP
jgi:twinkle protein